MIVSFFNKILFEFEIRILEMIPEFSERDMSDHPFFSILASAKINIS